MSEEDFVAFVGLLGPRIVRTGDVYWGEIRKFFYRPLWSQIQYHPRTIRRPLLSYLGGIQYAVPPDAAANSQLNWLLFDQTKEYSLTSLDKNRRRQVRLAAREFSIRPMTDVEEFKRQAYPVYLSFYERTRYKVGAWRRDPLHFGRWAEALFRIPHVLILGAYRSGELGGVSLSYQVRDTAFYATFFCNQNALDHYLSDLMLHSARESAAATPEVRQLIVGMFKGIRGLDDFYLLRGAKLVRQRARIEVNPLTRLLLKIFLPRQYAHLLGQLPDQSAAVSVAESDVPSSAAAEKNLSEPKP